MVGHGGRLPGVEQGSATRLAEAGDGQGSGARLAEALARIRALADAGGPAAPQPAAGPPEVTVSMPARNAAPWIGRAVASVLDQEGLSLELLVVDDASEDDTAERVGRFDDPRVHLLRSRTRRGIGHAHNRVLERARAPFIAHVDADDVVLPGGLRRTVSALLAAPGAGQACCAFYTIDDRDRLAPRTHAHREYFARRARPSFPYRRELLRHGMVANHLRTYRREVLDRVGPFGEDLPHNEDFDMALRIADAAELVFLPDFLYCRRVHGRNTTEGLRLQALRQWADRARLCRRRLRERGTLLGRGSTAVYGLLLSGLLDVAGVRPGRALDRLRSLR